MASFASTIIKCPFYISDDPKAHTLTCEGMLAGSSTKNRFDGREALRGHIMKHCAGDYRHCPWYIVLMRCKYRET